MRGLYGRIDNLNIDEARVVCQRPGLTVLPDAFPMLTIGTATAGSPRRDFCSDHGAMTGLHGLFDSDRIRRVGGICRGLERDPTSQRWTLRDTANHITPGRGVYDASGVAFNEQWTASAADDLHDRCPTGQVLVGVAARLGSVGEIASLAGQCADVDTWNSAGPSPLSWTSVYGHPFSTASLNEVRACPRRHYLVGFEVARSTVASSPGVARLTPLCRWFANP